MTVKIRPLQTQEVILTPAESPITVDVYVYSDEILADPDLITFDLWGLDSGVVVQDTFPGGSGRITNPNPGQYRFVWGATASEVESIGDYIGRWTASFTAVPPEGAEYSQKFRIISPAIYYMVAQLRMQIDKTKKFINTANDVFIGYTDAQLMEYLEQGLQTINAYPPAVVFTQQNYPITAHGSMWVDAALLHGVQSQMLFSLDTDVPSYNDQGQSFVLQHQPALAQYLTALAQRLDKLIPTFKMNYLKTGTVYVGTGQAVGSQQLYQASPSGALFRGMIFRW